MNALTCFVLAMSLSGSEPGSMWAQNSTVSTVVVAHSDTMTTAKLRVYSYQGTAYLRKTGKDGREITIQVSGEVCRKRRSRDGTRWARNRQ